MDVVWDPCSGTPDQVSATSLRDSPMKISVAICIYNDFDFIE
jgi:hypothetical protein